MHQESRFSRDGLSAHLMDSVSPVTSEPTYLIDDVARHEWRRMIVAFYAENSLPIAHQALLAGYCNAVARAIRAEKTLAQGERFYYETITKKGTVLHRRHPAAHDAERSWASARQFAKQLGITGRSIRPNAVSYDRRRTFK